MLPNRETDKYVGNYQYSVIKISAFDNDKDYSSVKNGKIAFQVKNNKNLFPQEYSAK
jgi:hypothetical protein